MKNLALRLKTDIWLVMAIVVLLAISILTLTSIAPHVFPVYAIYYVAAIAIFLFFASIDFDVLRAFSPHFYIASIILLLMPPAIGEVTRGAVRWIPLGPLTLQPAELARPFLILFAAYYMSQRLITLRRFLISVLLLAIPLVLILLQPSLGVTVLTAVGFTGVILAIGLSRKLLLVGSIIALCSLPLSWFVLAPYQKGRVMALIAPTQDPSGAGYNSIQSMISVGSGRLTGRGLGQGVQTQLAFLPERNTDFIFASIAEELGFLGAVLLVALSFLLLARILASLEKVKSIQARAFIAGIFFTLFTQVLVHVGMNMGLFPITGLPLPLVSSGGSSLIATMMALGMVVSAKNSRQSLFS